jgi:glycerate kinase
MTNANAPIIVIAPDSFKGSLSAQAVAAAIGAGVLAAAPQAQIRLCPIADGGEGTLDALLHAGGERRLLQVSGAAGHLRTAAVGILNDGSAVIESAEIVGLTDPAGTALAVEQRSTRGLGEALLALLDDGARRFLIGLGGSSTNDAGIGMLSALGMRLYDAADNQLQAVPAQLEQLVRVDLSELDPRLKDCQIVAMSDVDNPLCGAQGASAVFGPQKGVRAEQVAQLDHWLGHFAMLLEQVAGRHATNAPGAGAAGGLGYALLMLGAEFQSGAQTVADYIGLDEVLAQADWMITGEGRSDAQTLHGKAPFIAALRARAAGVPTSLLSGGIDRNALTQLQGSFSGCFSIVFGPVALQDAIDNAAPLLQQSAEQMTRLWLSARTQT